MDSGNGNFIPGESVEKLKKLFGEYSNHGGIFSVGEVVEIKGSFFKVSKILPKKMTLRLLTKNQAVEAKEDQTKSLRNKLGEYEKFVPRTE